MEGWLGTGLVVITLASMPQGQPIGCMVPKIPGSTRFHPPIHPSILAKNVCHSFINYIKTIYECIRIRINRFCASAFKPLGLPTTVSRDDRLLPAAGTCVPGCSLGGVHYLQSRGKPRGNHRGFPTKCGDHSPLFECWLALSIHVAPLWNETLLVNLDNNGNRRYSLHAFGTMLTRQR